MIANILEAQEYVPGTPGAPWSLEETLVVKAKLYSVFNQHGGYEALKQMVGDQPWLQGFRSDAPDQAKMLRLAFHDCLKYDDGTGGCDGCLNWKGMGTRRAQRSYEFTYPNVGNTDNNGLNFTVEFLEHLYTDRTFPKGLAPELKVSLKGSGKSRADLWAFASIASVEYGLETNQMVCDGTFNGNPISQCNQQKGQDNCKGNLKRPIQFQTGRKDCTEVGDKPFKATKHEVHPNAVGSGRMTAEFFQKEFGFSGRETVTILGAHTLGRFHNDVSLYRYIWTTKGEHMFNNDYYKNIIGEDKFGFNDDKCTLVSDAEGRKPKTR